MRQKSKLTEDDKKQIEKLYVEKIYTLNTIARLYHVAPETIKQILKQKGVFRLKSKQVTPEIEAKVVELFENDTVIGIYRILGISCENIQKILDKYNIPKHTKEEINRIKKLKTKKTCQERYGVDTPAQVPGAQEKRNKTIFEKYGVYNISQNEKIKEKKKQTTFRHFGVENPSQSSVIREKIERTNIERCGFEYYSMTPERREVLSKMMFETTTQQQEKCRKTCLEKYGVEYYFQTLSAQQKAKHNYYIDNLYFDSLPELALYIYAIDHEESIQRLPTKFTYIFEDKEHSYFPDFLYKNELVELKNNYLYQKLFIENTQDNEKYKCMLKHNIKIMLYDDYKFAIDYCVEKYGTKKFGNLFKKKKNINNVD